MGCFILRGLVFDEQLIANSSLEKIYCEMGVATKVNGPKIVLSTIFV